MRASWKAKSKVATDDYGCILDEIVIKNNPILIVYSLNLILSTRQHAAHVLKGIEYNSSTKGKYPNSKEIVTRGSTENCESEKWDTEVEKDKKVSFDNVTNAG